MDKDGEGYQQFTVQSGNGDIVLNQIGAPAPGEVKHTLTLNDAVIVKDDGSTATTGEYKEGVTVKIKPQIDDSKKYLVGGLPIRRNLKQLCLMMIQRVLIL